MHLKAVIECAKRNNSHQMYEFFRKYFAGENASVEDRLALLDRVVDYFRRSPDGDLGQGLRELVREAVQSEDLDRLEDVRYMGYICEVLPQSLD